MKIIEIPDPNESWAEVELFRWQYDTLPAENDMRPLDPAVGLKNMANAIEKGDRNNFPTPGNVASVLRYAANHLAK